MKKKTINFFYQILNKSGGYVDFKIAANENALTRPEFELGITGIKQMFFMANRQQKKYFEKSLGILYILNGRGGYTHPWEIP